MTRENERHWEVRRKQICGQMKREPLSWLVFERQNLKESRVKSGGMFFWFGKDLTRCVKASVGGK